jgi:hypothetical protein
MAERRIVDVRGGAKGNPVIDVTGFPNFLERFNYTLTSPGKGDRVGNQPPMPKGIRSLLGIDPPEPALPPDERPTDTGDPLGLGRDYIDPDQGIRDALNPGNTVPKEPVWTDPYLTEAQTGTWPTNFPPGGPNADPGYQEIYTPYGPDEERKWRLKPGDPANLPKEPVPAEADTPPELPISTLDPPTGALSFDDYLSKIKSAYPDLDFDNNPKQALADANAKRDLERTAMLAQLQLAAGMVSGAGKSWEGLGAGFANAGAAYDKGFEKYQNALQDSADRYAQQQDKSMAYDLARRKAALDLYSDEATRQSEDRRTLWKAKTERDYDVWKIKREDKKDLQKQDIDRIQHKYDKEFELLKPNEYGEPVSPEALADYWLRYDQGTREGRYIAPGNHHNLTAAK